MKQLKITIAGEVKTFDLPENGEYKCEVAESYVPKIGDCVMVQQNNTGILFWCKITETTEKLAYFDIVINSKSENFKNGTFEINDNLIFTKITPEELKAKYAEAGYDWDYESDTIKPIKWMPKDGDEVWYLDVFMKPISFIFRKDGYFEKVMLEKDLLFPTKEECKKFADHCLSYFNNK